MSGYYDSAQICLNGHVINENYHEYPSHNQNHCDKCGEQTIFKCPKCSTEIRGHYEVSGIGDLTGSYQAPNFCHACGNPYPWIQKKIEAAKEMAEELDELNDEEKQKLKLSLDDLIVENPKTEVAKIRFNTDFYM